MKHVTKVHYHSVSKNLDVYFDDDSQAVFSCEFLRVHSPSAEVQGHGSGPMKLVLNKQSVGIKNIVPVGHYALRLDFDDGHNSGLFSWSYFEKLQAQQQTLSDEYSARVADHEQNKNSVPIKFIP
ncbi:gamma-butyrobetaine hydroxylase-like domain-containing protein [Pseudoalteromonas arctica]|uniref:gamma-butyrobetaine hydroxylase-like domain-containing protein n=1 Tax=Pseudoalteromonas arctica TaxID=394751 RepID=UPI001C9CA5A5|nr:gamma-butyrobetaine hydroxylase-like domain-containing protein [Pseudoalteromonas arctica]MBZ2191496.1 gamma-butyrobetaine hydroxylase-like domain-containing protein [Pseudoalteromonas arctica]